MINRVHIDEYNKNGVVVIKSAIDIELLNQIKSEAQYIFKLAFKKNNITLSDNNEQSFNKAIFKLFEISFDDFLGCAKAAQHLLSLNNLASSRLIFNFLKNFGLKNPIICVKPIIFFNSPFLAKQEAHFKTPAHQDWRSMQGSLNSLVIWIPLVDVIPELGPVEFIYKSHLEGLRETEDGGLFQNVNLSKDEIKKFISIPVEKGDAVFFSAFTIHRSGNNISDDIRWSMHFRYNDLDESTFIERGLPHPYKVYHPDKDLIFKNFPSKNQLKEVFSND